MRSQSFISLRSRIRVRRFDVLLFALCIVALASSKSFAQPSMRSVSRVPQLETVQVDAAQKHVDAAIQSQGGFRVRFGQGNFVRPATFNAAAITIESDDSPPSEPQSALVQSPPVQTLAQFGDRDLNAPAFAFNFREAPWEMVLRNFARETHMSLHMATVPDGTFSYFDENYYSVSEAIDILNDYLLPKQTILVRHEGKLSVTNTTNRVPDEWVPYFRHEDLGLIGRNALATVVMPVTKMDPNSAVTEIQQMLSSVGHVRVLPNSNRLVVTDTGAYLRRVHGVLYGSGLSRDAVKSHVFRLRNAPAIEVATAINSFLLSKRAPLLHGSPTLPQINTVVPEKTTNSLLVHGTIEELTEIQALIQRMDSSPPQVLIQALLVEVQLGNTDEFGVEIGVQDSVLFDRGVVDNIRTITETIQEASGAKVTRQEVLSQTSTPGYNFNNQPLGNNSVANPGKIGPQALSNFGVGRVNGDLGFGGLVLSAGSESISILLRALSARFKTDVLSRPQIRALDNHEALIQIGQQVPIVDGVSVTAVGSANPVIRQDKAGIILKVIPRIGPDGTVLINVNAEKSAFQLAPGTGVPIFTDVTNGNVIEAPVKDITTANTSVSVKNGQTIVLGGMITKDLTVVERKVPVLGDIPLLGRAFRFDLEQASRRELLIFLTPQIILDDDHDEHLVNDEIARMCFPHEQAAQLHPEVNASRPNGLLPPPSHRYHEDAFTTDGRLIPTDPPVMTNAPGDWIPNSTWRRGETTRLDAVEFETPDQLPTTPAGASPPQPN